MFPEMNIKNFFNKFINLKSGNTKQAIENSKYEFLKILIGKVSSLIFTTIMARLLLPELFGLYSLALATILLFSGFSDLGINQTLISFLSKNYEKNQNKAKAFFNYLSKLKLILLFVVLSFLILSAGFISEFYNKPLFLALLVGAFYILVSGLFYFLEQIFKAKNDFKIPFRASLIFHVLRLFLIPLTIIILIKDVSQGFLIGSFIFVLAVSYLIALLFYFIKFKKSFFFRTSVKPLDNKEKNKVKKFILLLSSLSLSGVLAGYIDIMMLGYFVSSEFIGYYRAVFALTTSAASIIGFSGAAFFPIFNRLKGEQLERGFKKSVKVVSVLSIAGMIFTFIFANLIINIIYGPEYSLSVFLLQLFSLLLIFLPLVNIHEAYLMSQEKLKPLSFLYVVTIVLNIVLNYFLITYGLTFGMIYAILGAGLSTIITKFIYLIGLYFLRGKDKNVSKV